MVLKLECQFDTNAPKQSVGWSGRFLIERFWHFHRGIAWECASPPSSRVLRLLYFSWGVLTLGKVSMWLQGLEYSILQEETLLWQFYSWSMEIFRICSNFRCDVLRCDFGGLRCRDVRGQCIQSWEELQGYPHNMHLSLLEKSKILVLVAVGFWVGKRGHFLTWEQWNSWIYEQDEVALCFPENVFEFTTSTPSPVLLVESMWRVLWVKKTKMCWSLKMKLSLEDVHHTFASFHTRNGPVEMPFAGRGSEN